MTKQPLRLFAPIAALALAASAHAQAIPGLEDPAAIDRAVADFTGQPLGSPGGAMRPVDRRLRLTPCQSPLALSWRGDAHASVLVECPDPGGWHLFVATSGNALPGAAGSQAIQRGQAVTVALTGDGFSVSQAAEAMDSGAVGSWIRVRTAAKADPLQAKVVRPGLVVVPID